MRLVLVHGVGAHPRANEVRRDWIEALAKGMLAAGHDDVANRFLSGGIEVSVAHYAPLFLKTGAQGAGQAKLDEVEAELLHDLVTELVDGMAEHSRDAHDRAIIRRVRGQLEPSGQPQGSGAAARVTIFNFEGY